MKYGRILCFCVCFWLTSLPLTAQLTNKGKDFWIAYTSHLEGLNSAMGVYITSPVNTTGTIQVGKETPKNITIKANEVYKVFIGSTNIPGMDFSNNSVYLSLTDGIHGSAGIRVTTADPVSVFSQILRNEKNGATMVLPVTSLGSEYVVPGHYSTAEAGPNTYGEYSSVAVVATQPNTIIEVTPAFESRNLKPAGKTIQITLPNAGDVYMLDSKRKEDISGTIVRSVSSGIGNCKPIAVFSGSTWSSFNCTAAPEAASGDNLYQQIFPVHTWGRKFVGVPFGKANTTYRIFFKDQQTVIKVQQFNGTVITLTKPTASLANMTSFLSDQPVLITASQAVSVVQYMDAGNCINSCVVQKGTDCYGDADMVILNPVEQFINDVQFFSADRAYAPPAQSAITDHFVNIIIDKKFKQSVRIDNALPKGNFVEIQGTDYAYLQEDLTISSSANPVHRITADTGFSAIVYGVGVGESYAYNGGTGLKDISYRSRITNPYASTDSAITCINTPIQLSVPLEFEPTRITWDFSAAQHMNPSTTIGPVTNPVADSLRVINGTVFYYYSTGKSHTFSQPGTDTVTVHIYADNAGGCGPVDRVMRIPITVLPKPVASFKWDHTRCASDSVQFTALGEGNRFLWNMGNGSVYDKRDSVLKVLYRQSGDYAVSMQSVTDIGCISDPLTLKLVIPEAPKAGFLASAIRCVDSDIVFTDASVTPDGQLVQWQWNFDDGRGIITKTTNAQETIRYPSSGVKQVSLVVMNNNGCKSLPFKLIPDFVIHPSPESGFILPEVCLNDAAAQFIDSSKIAGGSSADFTYQWNFNAGVAPVNPGPDRTTGTEKNPVVKYNKAAHYNVTLEVRSKEGCAASKTSVFTVNGAVPKAAFDITSPLTLCSNKAVSLINRSTVDFGVVTRLEITWDLLNNPGIVEADEDPQPGKQYTHKYQLTANTTQSYTIRMRVFSGGNSCMHETTQTIVVHPAPESFFEVNPTAVCYNEPVNLFDRSNARTSSPVAGWYWDLGKGDIRTNQHPVKRFQDSGIQLIRLAVINDKGCISDTFTRQVEVFPNPVIWMGNKTLTVMEHTSITLSPVWVYGNNLQFNWTPVSFLGSTSTFTTVSTPLDDITYRLTVTGIGNCAVSDTVRVILLKTPVIPNAFSPNGDGIHDVWDIKYLERYPGATVDIFNRFGQVVYRSSGYSRPWDGKLNGKVLPIGTYYYIVNPKNGRPLMSGAITIIK
jgi:gliding motility-associated-like protein